jgi:phage gpG-like protein
MVKKGKFVDFRVDPKGSFKKALLRAGKRVDDLRIPFKLITDSFYKSNKFLFEPGKKRNVFEDLSDRPLYAFWLKSNSRAVQKNDGSKFFEGGYKDLKQKTHGFIYPILKASGALEESLTKPTDRNTIATVLNRKSLLLGTKLPYAPYLQFGTKKMPARPFLVVGTESGAWANSTHMQRRKERWMELLEKYCSDSLRKGKK